MEEAIRESLRGGVSWGQQQWQQVAPQVKDWTQENVAPAISKAKTLWNNADIKGKLGQAADFAKAKWGQLTQKDMMLMSMYDRCSCHGKCYGSASCIAAFDCDNNPESGPWAEGCNGMYEEDSLLMELPLTPDACRSLKSRCARNPLLQSRYGGSIRVCTEASGGSSCYR